MTNNDREIMETWLKALASAVLTAILAFMLLAMCGCKTTKYVPIEHTELRTDTLYKAIWHTDSIINTDTIRITEQGTEIIKWRVRTKNVHDTIYQTRYDSIYVDKVVEVERKAHWWETALMWVGGIGLLLIAWMIYGKIKHRT